MEGTWVFPGTPTPSTRFSEWSLLVLLNKRSISFDQGPLLPRQQYELKHNFIVWAYHA